MKLYIYQEQLKNKIVVLRKNILEAILAIKAYKENSVVVGSETIGTVHTRLIREVLESNKLKSKINIKNKIRNLKISIGNLCCF